MTLEQLGWNAHVSASFEIYQSQNLLPARVAREDRESYVIYLPGRAMRAAVSGSMRYTAVTRADFPAVGDWVAVAPRGAEPAATIHALIPRRSCVTRKTAGTRAEPQLIAANIDHLLICCALDHDFNLRRIERYVALAQAGGVAPLILLTKADCNEHADARLAQVQRTCPGIPTLTASIIDLRGVEELRRLLGPGVSAALVGSSGVGKSSLINCLIGENRLATAAVRAHDSHGRHTTTHRQLLLLPAGGVIIDTPGMRELQAWADADDINAAFDDIDNLAGDCRFRDCRHETEPGCAVLAAVSTGDLDAARLENYRKQLRELSYLERKEDPALAAAERDKWKVLHKAAKKHMKDKYRY